MSTQTYAIILYSAIAVVALVTVSAVMLSIRGILRLTSHIIKSIRKLPEFKGKDGSLLVYVNKDSFGGYPAEPTLTKFDKGRFVSNDGVLLSDYDLMLMHRSMIERYYTLVKCVVEMEFMGGGIVIYSDNEEIGELALKWLQDNHEQLLFDFKDVFKDGVLDKAIKGT